MHTLKRSAGRKPCKGASQQGSEPHTCSTVSAGDGPSPKMCSGQLMTTSATSCGEPSSVASSSIVSPGLGKLSTSVLIRGHRGRLAGLHRPEQQWGSPERQQQEPAQQHCVRPQCTCCPPLPPAACRTRGGAPAGWNCCASTPRAPAAHPAGCPDTAARNGVRKFQGAIANAGLSRETKDLLSRLALQRAWAVLMQRCRYQGGCPLQRTRQVPAMLKTSNGASCRRMSVMHPSSRSCMNVCCPGTCRSRGQLCRGRVENGEDWPRQPRAGGAERLHRRDSAPGDVRMISKSCWRPRCS